MKHPTFDLAEAHRYFSADCFNRTWTLIDKTPRTPADDEAMVLLALASLWHWTERADCTSRERSVGHWQVSRVYTLVGQGQNALQHGERSLEYAADLSPFYRGYAHEAIARAAKVLGDTQRQRAHIELAKRCAAEAADPSERVALENDLRSLD